MKRSIFDGFSIELPPGWSELDDEATYSDPTEGERTMFGRPGAAGSLYVSVLAHDADDPPTGERAHVEGLATRWGRARGLGAPVSLVCTQRADGALAMAEYKLAGDYVAVAYFGSELGTIHATYSTIWREREEDRDARDAMITSLRFA